jgi:MoxR-like ATPase
MQTYFQGQGQTPPAALQPLPVLNRAAQSDPRDYEAGPALAAAVNVALALGQPLLLTGEPGTGKTELALRVAWERRLGKPLEFFTKSTSIARDLYYTVDNVGRFHKERGPEAVHYLTLNALGRAIVESCPMTDVSPQIRQMAGDWTPRQSVVLIDEIDKAPRDFPNDLLNEISRNMFRIPELVGNVEISANPEFRPIVIITSNSEKNLPEPFLRRCVFHHIEFPGAEMLERILGNRLRYLMENPSRIFLASCVKFFLGLRGERLLKPISTAELINWVAALVCAGASTQSDLKESKALLPVTLGALLKNPADRDSALQFSGRFFS